MTKRPENFNKNWSRTTGIENTRELACYPYSEAESGRSPFGSTCEEKSATPTPQK